jgi:hypothetical protein
MRTLVFVLLAILSASASTLYLGASTRLPVPNKGDINQLAAQKTTLSQPVTLMSTSFFVTSELRRKPTPKPTPVPSPTPTRGQVSLAWILDKDSAVVGYNLYYTTNPSALAQAMSGPIPGTVDRITGMSTTSTTLTGLSSGAVFYFGLTAYNANGIESVLSDVVSTPVP